MPKKELSEDYMISETGNWNVAAEFTKEKIMKPLARCDVYEDIARYGYEDFFEELIYYNIPRDVSRIKAAERLIGEMLKLMNNCKFAMKKKGTLAKIYSLEGSLKKIKKDILPGLYKTTSSQVTKESNIRITNPLVFEKVLESLSRIKSDLNTPLNQNHLIFTDREEFDPLAFKDHIKHRMVNRG